MTAHELAKRLLDMPDVEVGVYDSSWDEYRVIIGLSYNKLGNNVLLSEECKD